MKQRRLSRVAVAVGLVMLLTAASVSLAGAYAEEPLPFRDPYTDQVNHHSELSSVHFDLTYVMALAAGFSEDDSRTLMLWDQLVDSNVLSTTNSSYTNCLGTFPAEITEQCTNPRPGDKLFWPNWAHFTDAQRAAGASCVTSRYGPFEGFFHFPRDGSDLEELHDWGWFENQELVGYEGYVWGPNMNEGTGFFGNTCFYTQRVTINTGIRSGSLPAFATYLHSLADSYSHLRCREKTDALGRAWPTHTVPYPPVPEAARIYECNYAPTGVLRYYGDSHHGREFGTMWPDDSGRTKAAVVAVYNELKLRSELKPQEGLYQAFELDTPLAGRGIFHKLTLGDALNHYVEQWNWKGSQARREYLDQLAQLILATRSPRS